MREKESENPKTFGKGEAAGFVYLVRSVVDLYRESDFALPFTVLPSVFERVRVKLPLPH